MRYVELSRGHGYKILKDIIYFRYDNHVSGRIISDNVFYTVICKPQY